MSSYRLLTLPYSNPEPNSFNLPNSKELPPRIHAPNTRANNKAHRGIPRFLPVPTEYLVGRRGGCTLKWHTGGFWHPGMPSTISSARALHTHCRGGNPPHQLRKPSGAIQTHHPPPARTPQKHL